MVEWLKYDVLNQFSKADNIQKKAYCLNIYTVPFQSTQSTEFPNPLISLNISL